MLLQMSKMNSLLYVSSFDIDSARSKRAFFYFPCFQAILHGVVLFPNIQAIEERVKLASGFGCSP